MTIKTRTQVEIIPALMPNSLNELKEAVSLVKGSVQFVQIDVMDGKFVAGTSWPFPDFESETKVFVHEEEGLPFWQEVNYEFDLMTKDPERVSARIAGIGAARIVIHVESDTEEKISNSIKKMKELSVETGLALNIDTPLEEVFRFLDGVPESRPDFIQCMGIRKIGYQGEHFDERVLSTVKSLRTRYPDLIISIDGGVNFESAPRLISAGANRLVAGSVIFRSPRPSETIRLLERV